MNLASILVGAALICAILLALSFMNKGKGSCGGNCSTCAMSEHCEKQAQNLVETIKTEVKKEGKEDLK